MLAFPVVSVFSSLAVAVGQHIRTDALTARQIDSVRYGLVADMHLDLIPMEGAVTRGSAERPLRSQADCVSERSVVNSFGFAECVHETPPMRWGIRR